jgi:hypothetical protein
LWPARENALLVPNGLFAKCGLWETRDWDITECQEQVPAEKSV